MEYHTEETLQKLADSVAHHFEELKPLRQKRELLLCKSAGTLYEHSKERDSEYQDILNLMKQAAEAMTISLAANRPRFLVVANTVAQQPFADHFERALNKYAEVMHLEESLQECARNAFYFLGIAKVSMGTSVSSLVESDEWIAPGQPFCNSVSPNHFCYDTDATDFRHCSFMADRYRVRYRDLIQDQRFNSAVRAKIRDMGPESIRSSQEAEWGNPLGSGNSEFEEFVFLTDIFLPKDGVIYTFPCNERWQFTTRKPIASMEWTGREEGPYHFLNFGPVPDKTTPSSPAQNLVLLHNLCNSMYRKLGDQAERQKQLLIGPKGNEDDLDAVINAEDGTGLSLNEPERVRTERFDGPDQQNFAFMLNALERFSEQGGNLRHQLGTAQSADTASQESMIGANVGRVEGAYQNQFVKFTRGIAQEIGSLLYEDEVTDVPMTQQIQGTEISYDDPWQGANKEGSREGNFTDYGLNIDPYSMPYRSPDQRLQQIDQTVDRMMPALPLIMQQGGVFDVKEYLRIRAKYIDMPELENIFKFQQPVPQEEQQQQGGHERTLAGNTNREYTHRSVPGQQGPQGDSIQQMMAAGQSNGQMQGA